MYHGNSSGHASADMMPLANGPMAKIVSYGVSGRLWRSTAISAPIPICVR